MGSQEAPVSIRNEVLQYDTSQGLTYTNICLAVALKAKYGKAFLPFIQKMKEMWEDKVAPDQLAAFVHYLQQGRIDAAERLLAQEHLHFRMRIYYQLIGVIMLEDKAPQDWKVTVRSMCSVIEKPYLGRRFGV